MIKRSALGVLTLLVLLIPDAADAAQRTFVSAVTGTDANPCTRALPCRGFAAAIAETDPEGEVVVVDTGGYGPVTITQSAALIAPTGVHAAITAFAGNAIDIDAGPTDVVILRGLYLNGLGGAEGIDFASGATLHVEHCVVNGFTARGVYGTADGSDVYVSDTLARHNHTSFVFEADTEIRAFLDSIRAEENLVHGVTASTNSVVTVTRSVSAGNGSIGFFVTSLGILNLEGSTATMNLHGIRAFGTVRVSNSLITGNTNGVTNTLGANTISSANNTLLGNGTDGTFTATVPQQ